MKTQRYKLARKIRKLTLAETVEKLGISQPTISAWEGGRKNPSVESLAQMADLYNVSTDFLLGRDENLTVEISKLQPVSARALNCLHGQPVWSEKYGWLLVDAIEQCLFSIEHGQLPFSDIGDLYVMPSSFSVGYQDLSEPLTLGEVKRRDNVWLEPISPDSQTRIELRGWYQVFDRYVQNEYGNRFYMDTYGAKWLAFDSKLE